MSALYRVRTLEASLVARALALGVHGTVVPQVSTREDAARLVRAAKFAPVGERGVSRGRRAFGVADFLERENDETMLVVQLEDPTALGNIEDICAVDGIDVVFVGPDTVDRFRSLGVRFMYTPADSLLAAAAADWLGSVTGDG